jgi:hypothetical protein
MPKIFLAGDLAAILDTGELGGVLATRHSALHEEFTQPDFFLSIVTCNAPPRI